MAKIAYRRLGAGVPVILVHGIGHHKDGWGILPQMLVDQGFEVILIDLPGHGQSGSLNRPEWYTMPSTCAQLREFLQSIGVARPHALGNSLGGQIVLELAARDLVASATALAPAGFYLTSDLPYIGANLLKLRYGAGMSTRDSHARALVPVVGPRQGLAHRVRRLPRVARRLPQTRIRRPQHRSGAFWWWSLTGVTNAFTRHPKVPVTIAWGEDDRLLLPSNAAVALARVPEATHAVILDAGHSPQVDAPETVVQLFLQTVAQADQ